MRLPSAARGLSGMTLRRMLFALGAVLVGINILSAIWDIRNERAVVERNALRDFSNLTALLADQTARSLESVDLLLHAAAGDISTAGVGPPAARALRFKDRISGIPQIRAVILLDRNGKVLVSTDGGADDGADFSKRPYFTHQRDAAVKGRYVSDPFLGEITHRWAFAVSETITDADGRFAGVVAAIIDIQYFDRLYHSLDIGEAGFVALLTRGGILVTRVPRPREELFGNRLPDRGDVLGAIERDGRLSGWSPGLVSELPTQVLMSGAPVPDSPLVVIVGAPDRTVLAPWRTEAARIIVRTLLTSAVMLALVALAARELLRRAHADGLLDELFESAPEAVALLDLDGRVIRTNREFATVFGFTAEESTGRLLSDLIVPAGQLDAACMIDTAANPERRVSAECERKRKDGSRIQVAITASPVTIEGKTIGVYTIQRDITERKLAEAEQERLQARLRQAEKMEAVGRLAGGIAHDFNNILGGILGYGEMLLESTTEGSQEQRFARNLLIAANRARDLVDQILAYSRSQRAARGPVEIGAIVRETLEVVRGSLPTGIVLEPALPQAPVVALCDPTQLHQVVMNLCTNAIHAMGCSGTLGVSLAAVDLEEELKLPQATLSPGPYVKLVVADTGVGMDEATLARIFEPFFTTKEVGRGTGLGLALVYGIVADSGGATHVTSVLGRGSMFEIYLPRADVAGVAVENSQGPIERGHGERVLLVDDEKPLLIMTAELLSRLGYDPAPFSDPHSALASLEAMPEAYDIVLTDEMMPGLTGTALARAARKARADLPIILISGYTGPMLTQMALEAGVREVLRKPVQSRELAAALARGLAA
jgi:PAS domain S-box-containing protein